MQANPHAIDTRRQILDTARDIIGGKGFAAVGLNEVLVAAGVPKGSFYYYFASKDAFGVALLERYFEEHLVELDAALERPGLSNAERLMDYCQDWREQEVNSDPKVKCLVVKLGAEVSDLSEAMRRVLERGTTRVIRRLACAIEGGIADASLAVTDDPYSVAETLFQTWLGASLLAKITHNAQPFEAALASTRHTLGLPTTGLPTTT